MGRFFGWGRDDKGGELGSGNEGIFRGFGRLGWGCGERGDGADNWDASSPIKKVRSAGTRNAGTVWGRWERASLTPCPCPSPSPSRNASAEQARGEGSEEVGWHYELKLEKRLISSPSRIAPRIAPVPNCPWPVPDFSGFQAIDDHEKMAEEKYDEDCVPD